MIDDFFIPEGEPLPNPIPDDFDPAKWNKLFPMDHRVGLSILRALQLFCRIKAGEVGIAIGTHPRMLERHFAITPPTADIPGAPNKEMFCLICSESDKADMCKLVVDAADYEIGPEGKAELEKMGVPIDNLDGKTDLVMKYVHPAKRSIKPSDN